MIGIKDLEKENVSDDRASKDGNKKKTAGSKTADIVATVLTWLLSAAIIVAALLFAFNTSPTKSIFGFRYYTVLTPSMSPAYEVGDVVFVQITPPESINIGDVITFNPSLDNDAYLTHRVTEKLENYEGTGVTCFKTKGDANDSEDSFLIESERVIGTVRFRIPKMGYVIRFVQLRWYFVVPITVMLIVLIILLRAYFSDEEDDKERSSGGSGEEPAAALES